MGEPGSRERRVLSQALQVANATTAVLLVGPRLTHLGAVTHPSDFGSLVSALVVPDATLDPELARHAEVRDGRVGSVLGFPLGGGATLWLLAHARGQLTEQTLAACAAFVPWWTDALAAGAIESHARELVERLSTPALFVNGEHLWPNDAACMMTTYARSQLVNLDAWFALLFADEAPTARALYLAERELVRAGGAERRTFPIVRRDGSECLIEWTITVSGPNEVWLLSDVSEHVASQERFRLLFDQSATPYLLLDDSGVLDCNRAAVNLLGHSSKYDVVGQALATLSPPVQPSGDDSVTALKTFISLAYAQGGHRFEWMHRRADGTPLSVETALTPITLGARRVLLTEWHDVTERVRYEAGLKQARDSALEFARAKSDFLATMSHEVRTPLNGVLGMTRLLLDTPLEPVQREYAQTAYACSEGLLALINDVLDFSKLEAGKVQLERLSFSLVDVVEECLAVVAETAQRKHLLLASLFDGEVPALVEGDPTRLRQVLLNLMSNAVKFTEHGGVTVRVEAGPSDERRQRVVQVSVADTGIGIAATALPRLFAPFSQEDSSITRRFGGTGLGLAISRRLVSLMGGIVDVTSSAGGTTFTVSLTLPVVEQGGRSHELAGVRVGVLDAESVQRESLVRCLEHSGALPALFEDMPAAIAGLGEVDVVLVDGALEPRVLEGLHRAASGRVPVGVLTQISKATSMRAGFTVHRPLRRRQVVAAIARAVRGSESGVFVAPKMSTTCAGLRVLVAEDNPVNQRVIRGLLDRLGCVVEVVGDGEEVLEAIDRADHDVVLMDCQMPKLDGFETTRRLRQLPRGQLPIVALTASAFDEDRQRCTSAGMSDFLAKPVKVEELERMLRNWQVPARSAA